VTRPATVLMLAVALSGCAGDKPRPELSASLTVITVDGSGALLPLLLEAGNQFMRQTPHTIVLASAARETAAVQDVLDGQLSLAATSLPVNDASEARLEVRNVCDVALVVVANPGRFNEHVHSLTRAELRGIVQGKINNWTDVGGEDQRIVFVDQRLRGDHVALSNWLGLNDFAPPTAEEASAATIQSELTARLGALSFVALPYRHPALKVLALDGIEPSVANVSNNRYSLRMRERVVLRKDAPAAVRAFADFLLSPAVQDELIEQLGYAPVTHSSESKR
jgi:phosphate transport system substrate-binding protein